MAKVKEILKKPAIQTDTDPIWARARFMSRYSAQLAQYSTVFLVGIIAIMTFLLTAGLQHPKIDFSIFLYASLVTLSLSLVCYVIANGFKIRSFTLSAQITGKGDEKKEKQLKTTEGALMFFQVAQQLLFVLGVIAVALLAIVSAQLFFAAAASAASASTGAAPQ